MHTHNFLLQRKVRAGQSRTVTNGNRTKGAWMGTNPDGMDVSFAGIRLGMGNTYLSPCRAALYFVRANGKPVIVH